MAPGPCGGRAATLATGRGGVMGAMSRAGARDGMPQPNARRGPPLVAAATSAGPEAVARPVAAAVTPAPGPVARCTSAAADRGPPVRTTMPPPRKLMLTVPSRSVR